VHFPLPLIRDAIRAMHARRWIPFSLLALACSPAEPVTVVEADASPSRDVTRADAGFDMDARFTTDVPPLDAPRADLVAQDLRDSPVNHVFRSLDAAGVTWKDYAGGARMVGFFPYFGILRTQTRAHDANIEDLHRDLAMGTLPAVSFIEPNYLGDGGERVDEHPPGIPMQGERWVERIVRSLMASPLWSRSALFVVYDEHGGFADHVAPPAACEPDALPPRLSTGPAEGRFDRYGVRVPFMVVSPYARRRYVSHRTFDHGSILRFIEARFGLPALTRRDANANIPTDLFDFANPPFMTPPTLPAAGTVDPAVRARCTAAFPSAGAF
jgi:phospholipase C